MVDPVPQKVSMNTTQILLSLNKKLFSNEPEKLSDNNRVLRLFTYLDSRAATNLGGKIKRLPNVAQDQEKAETMINRFRSAKTEAAITAFNLFVDEIQSPSNRSAQYTQQLGILKKAYNTFIEDLSTTMKKVLPQSMADTKMHAYLDALKSNDRYPQIASEIKTLDVEGNNLHTVFGELAKKAEITLSAVAPDVVMAEKNRNAQKPQEPPSGFAIE